VSQLESIIGVSAIAYLATMLDNLAAFSAQLSVAPPEYCRRLGQWQSAAVGVLVGAAALLGSALRVIPLSLLALGALAPWWLGWQAWRHRHEAVAAPSARHAFSVFAVTLSLGGDNVAVWAPLIRLHGLTGFALTTGTFALCQLLFLAAARTLATHPAVRARSERVGQLISPWLYGVLGLVIVATCLGL